MAWQLLMMLQITAVLENAGIQVSKKSKHSHKLLVMQASKSGTAVLKALDCATARANSSNEYLTITTEPNHKAAFRSFLNATSNKALCTIICGVCARECESLYSMQRLLSDIPNCHLLIPESSNPHMSLIDGLLLAEEAVYSSSDGGLTMKVCSQCHGDLMKNRLPLQCITAQ